MAKQKRSKTKPIIITVIVLLLAGGGTWMAMRKREVPITIQTEKVSRRNLIETVVANGRIQPVLQVVINPEVSGEIIELPVKEGQQVKKGDLLVKIKPDNYLAQRASAEAQFMSAQAGKALAKANLEKAEFEYQRIKKLYENELVSESEYLRAKTDFNVMQASFETSTHQGDQAKASLDRSTDDLAKTTITSPIDGTVTKLKSQKGERVVGTAMMAGTEIMTVANLDEMEARVDIGEIDVVLIALGQKAMLEVDAFQDRKFAGTVTEIANASKGATAMGGNNNSQEATKFEVKIRVTEKENFRPGMSVTAEIETRYRTNVLTVPIQSVTTRLPKGPVPGPGGPGQGDASPQMAEKQMKEKEKEKPQEIVFLHEGESVKAAKVKTGISDSEYIEIVEGLEEGKEVVSGGYKAISKDLEDGKKVKKGPPPGAEQKKG
ncbi:MAG: efflux RND transporter periplasmic adaptor subunit [Verrucomicrobiota bacterium]|nr:efflux RND transporter periplasmic adaptor subunit [Verrucomicrobiota bacterium]